MSRKVKKEKFFDLPSTLEAKTEAQGHYMLGIKSSIITFGIGSAGTGKTFVPAIMAADGLYNNTINRIIITRPAVESGRGLGYLKGDLDDKYAPYLAPIENIICEKYGKNWYQSQRNNENIIAVPLEHMQGHTFDNAYILFDEAQNSTPEEMFMVLSRVGEYSKLVITGDPKMQKMIKGDDGLSDAVKRLEHLNQVSIINFTSNDIVRSGIAKEIVLAYEGEYV